MSVLSAGVTSKRGEEGVSIGRQLHELNKGYMSNEEITDLAS